MKGKKAGRWRERERIKGRAKKIKWMEQLSCKRSTLNGVNEKETCVIELN